MLDSAKILVVDDTPANLEVITETLTSEGYQVATAISGDRALKRLQTHLPDLILLDVKMPGIDGFETCQQIKENPVTTGIPVIFITALTDTRSIVKGFSLGAVDYIGKPFQEPELLARVKTHLQLQQMTISLENRVLERTHELQSALAQLQESQLQLVQQEKMSALGNLVAGVAHEINNPVGFLQGNLQPAREYINDLFDVLELYRQEHASPSQELQNRLKEIDLEFVQKDLINLLHSMHFGIQRIADISNSLRTFSRSDQTYKTECNLHEGIDSTLLILKHRLKADECRPTIEVVKYYGDLPQIQCFPGQLNQVFMNILANAIDALEESNQGKSYAEIEAAPNQIMLKTMLVDKQVFIHIRDNGAGMPEDIKRHIFDHLFTTKEMGKGTGLGLAIAHQIVVEKHRGSLTVESEVGQGSEFVIQLPV